MGRGGGGGSCRLNHILVRSICFQEETPGDTNVVFLYFFLSVGVRGDAKKKLKRSPASKQKNVTKVALVCYLDASDLEGSPP